MKRWKLLPLVAAVVVALMVPTLVLAADDVVVKNNQVAISKEPVVSAIDRISWSAVLAGAAVALAIHAGLSTLGIGIGAAAVDPQNRENPVKGVTTTLLIWMFVSGLIALFAGSWVSGRLAGTVPFDSSIHGIIMWSIATIMLLILATTSAGAVLGGMFRLLGAGVNAAGSAVGGIASAAGHVAGGAASAAGSVVSAVAPQLGQVAKDVAGEALPQLDWKGIQKEAKKMLKLGNNDGGEQGKNQQGNKQGENNQGGQGQKQDEKSGDKLAKLWNDKDEVIEMVTKAFGAIRDGGLPNADREELMSVISERAGVSKEEANKTLENWEKKYREVKQQYDAAIAKAEQKARDAAEATTKAISRVAIWTFASLLVGLAVSAIGGNLGSTFMRM